ncbi:MAG: chlorophyll synthesis pathway protein BchC [Chlorobiales bacterium]
MKSKAVVFYAPEALEVREVELREPGSDDVVIETYWTSVSAGTEKMLFQGKLPPMQMTSYPVIPGYETVGKIIQCGENVPDSALNTFVYVSGSLGYVDVNAAWGGASALIVSPFHKTIRVDSISNVWLGLALPLGATALHAVDLAEVSRKKVLVLGQGAVGLLVVELAKHFGAELVVATDLNSERLAQSSANIRVHIDNPAADHNMTDALSGMLCDVMIDCTGSMKAIEQSFAHLVMNAKVILAGFYQRIDLPYHMAFMKELTFVATKQWRLGDLERVRDLIAREKINAKKIFTHHSSVFNGIQEAYQTAFNDPTCLKMVLNWKED